MFLPLIFAFSNMVKQRIYGSNFISKFIKTSYLMSLRIRKILICKTNNWYTIKQKNFQSFPDYLVILTKF